MGYLSQTNTPKFMLWALRYQLAVAFWYAAVAKMDPDWINGTVPAGILSHPQRQWILKVFGNYSHFMIGYGGLLLDFLGPIFMFSSRKIIRTFTQCAIIGFHCSNTALFGVSGIGAFSFLMISSWNWAFVTSTLSDQT